MNFIKQFPHLNLLDVKKIENVPVKKHVLTENAKTHAHISSLVQEMQNARFIVHCLYEQ
jgi:hypothetical protein